MDLLLRGRGADVGARAPVWFVRCCGAALGVAAMALAEMLGISYVTGINPVNLRAFAAVVGALVAPSAWGTLLWITTFALGLVVFAVTLTPVAGPLARSFVRADAITGNFDALIVLSGSLTDDGRLSGQVIDRLLTALREVQQRRIPTLALSVVDRKVDGVKVNTEADQRALVAMLGGGVDARFVYDVHSTRDEALAFAAMGRTHQWTRVLVISSPTHTRRACRAMEVAGLRVQCMPAESRDYSLAKLYGPQARILAFQDAVYEFAATVLYRFRGWN